MKEPTKSEIQRVSHVLQQFVQPWALPLNPENLDLMAYCALKGLNSNGGWSELESLVAEEIQRDTEQHQRRRKAMQKSLEQRKEGAPDAEAP